ncbi:nucleotidyltransferase [Sulfolobus acidocaldarius SUSAZ]|nr:nucleotidyltransferase [Sulfolobus acidocaldarius SUSAZ]
MKAVILAAGSGERLEPVTQTRPKQFIPILGKPLISYVIEELRKLNLDIIIVVNNAYKEYFESRIGSLVKLVIQNEGKGTAAALNAVRNSVSGNENILLMYGDVFLGDLGIIEKVIREESENVILGVRVQNPKDYGVLVADYNNELKEIIEKPENPPSNLINGGIYKLGPDIFHYLDKISKSPRGELELTDAVSLMSKSSKVKVLKYEGFWIDIGRPWDILSVNKWALDNLLYSKNVGNVEDFVKIKGKVIIEEGAEIRSFSYIEGPTYIGKGCHIGPHSYIRPYTVLLNDVKIGTHTEIKESVVMENSKIPHLSYVGDSVIGEDVNFGAGTVIANLRFDEKDIKMNVKGQRVSSGRKKLGAIIGDHVRTGINVTILPGIKIGAYAKIYPGSVVNRDVNQGEFFKA